MKRLQELARRISSIPEAVEVQSRVAKIYNDRKEMAEGNKLFDWGGRKTSLTPRWWTKAFRCACRVKTPAVAPSSTVTR